MSLVIGMVLEFIQSYFIFKIIFWMSDDKYRIRNQMKFLLMVVMATVLLQIKVAYVEIGGPILSIIFLVEAVFQGVMIHRYTGRSIIWGIVAYNFVTFLAVPAMLLIMILRTAVDPAFYANIVVVEGGIFAVCYILLHMALLSYGSGRIHQVINRIFKIVKWPVFIFVSFFFGSLIIDSVSMAQKISGYEVESILLIVFSIVLLLVFLVAIFKEFKLLKKQLNNQVKQLGDYSNTLESIYENIAQYRHEISRGVKGVSNYIDKNDHEGLIKHLQIFNERSQLFSSEEYQMLAQIEALKIDTLKGLIISKYQRAKALGITFEAGILEQLQALPIGDVDLCRLSGILLDNAIEAASLADEKHVSLFMFRTASEEDEISEKWTLQISNSYVNGVGITSEKSFKKSSKGSDRGIGLKSLTKIIASHVHIQLKTDIEQERVTQRLVIEMV